MDNSSVVRRNKASLVTTAIDRSSVFLMQDQIDELQRKFLKVIIIPYISFFKKYFDTFQERKKEEKSISLLKINFSYITFQIKKKKHIGVLRNIK